jgi:hypothetical protein
MLKGDEKMNNALTKATDSGITELPNNLRGRSIVSKVIPTICNLENMLGRLVELQGDFSQLKQWEKRSYKAYKIDKVKSKIVYSDKSEWREILRRHILDGNPLDFGASCIDIYLVEYVSESYGKGKDKFYEYIAKNDISDKVNSAQAIWQAGMGDGVFLGTLNYDGTIKDWEFNKEWLKKS